MRLACCCGCCCWKPGGSCAKPGGGCVAQEVLVASQWACSARSPLSASAQAMPVLQQLAQVCIYACGQAVHALSAGAQRM